MRELFKNKGVKVWIIVTSIVVTLLVAATLVLRFNYAVYGSINSIYGGSERILVSGDPSQYERYTTEYKTKAEMLKAANALNEEICSEGFTLLKNNNNALPLVGSSKVSVFGKSADNLVYGGSGSSAGSKGTSDDNNIYTSLESAGFSVNPSLRAFYSDKNQSGADRPVAPDMGKILTGFPIAETPLASYTQEVKNSYSSHNDAAIVVISRIGGEGFDLPRTMAWDGSIYDSTSNKLVTVPGASSMNAHYLQLDLNEQAMLKEANDNFGKVIVIINSSATMELGFLNDSSLSNIKAALWIGNPGKSGIKALGKILKGEVNPSGKTVDTYARDFKKDPSWQNFGNNLVSGGNKYKLNGTDRNAYFVEYEEGIYVGYRYYETRGITETDASWYDNNVIYPMGYGLSYTSFSKEIVGGTAAGVLDKNGKVEMRVKVKNTGASAGKEVVQIYYTAPYTSGEIEKAHVVLAAFEKTKLLAPGEEQTLDIEFDVRDMASYDYNNANKNSFTGYELDGGSYEIKLMNNAHDIIDSKTYTIPTEGYQYANDATTNQEIENLFDDVSSHIKKYMSRSKFTETFPTMVTAADRETTSEIISSLTYKVNDKETDPWFSKTTPSQQKYAMSQANTKVKLSDLIGKSYDDKMWDELLDQLTVTQMEQLIGRGNFHTEYIEGIDKPLTTDADGPMGFALFMGDPTVYDTCYYASECVIGATWNVELAFKMGEMIGNEGLLGNAKGDGRPYSGWYAPAINIHRSQFGGRNFEYYSEDPTLSGKFAANVVKGAKSKGVYTYVKHFAVNDQETNRDTTGLVTWLSEQAMREIYFKPFEIAVKEGKTTAMMSSFNRLGTEWAGGSYNLLTKLLRQEWGFNGMVITDYNLLNYMDLEQMIRAGGDLNLSQVKDLPSKKTATALTNVRKATKNILYTVANSNAMNGQGEGVIYRYTMPTWFVLSVLSDIAIFVGMAIWGVFVIIKAKKSLRNKVIIVRSEID